MHVEALLLELHAFINDLPNSYFRLFSYQSYFLSTWLLYPWIFRHSPQEISNHHLLALGPSPMVMHSSSNTRCTSKSQHQKLCTLHQLHLLFYKTWWPSFHSFNINNLQSLLEILNTPQAEIVGWDGCEPDSV